MGSLSNKAELSILDASVGRTILHYPALWLALYTVPPTDSTFGTEVSSSSTGYTRIKVSEYNDFASWVRGSFTGVTSSVLTGATSYTSNYNTLAGKQVYVVSATTNAGAYGIITATGSSTTAIAVESWSATPTGSGTFVIPLAGSSPTVKSVFAAADSGSIKNSGGYNASSSGLVAPNSGTGGTITFPQATANWTTVTAIALLNSATGTSADNIVWYGNLTASRTVNSGDTVSFAANDLVLSID